MKKIYKSDAEWQNQLNSAEYQVLRNEATERPYSSPLNKKNEKVCIDVKVAGSHCSSQNQNLTVVPAGRVFILQNRIPWKREEISS